MLAASHDPLLRPHVGQTVDRFIDGDKAVSAGDAVGLQRSPRWVISDAERVRQRKVMVQMAAAMAQGPLTVVFANGEQVDLHPPRLQIGNLTVMFWLLSGLGFTLAWAGLMALTARHVGRNLVYATMALCQGLNLIFIAVEMTTAFGLPEPVTRWDMPVRMALDLLTGAAIVTAACFYLQRLPGATGVAATTWLIAILMAVALGFRWLPNAWWATQIAVLVFGASRQQRAAR